MSEREYVVVEILTAVQYVYVRANSKEEALEKAKYSDGTFTVQGDIYPSRPMALSNVRVSHDKIFCSVCGARAIARYPYVSGLCEDHQPPRATVDTGDFDESSW